MASNSNAANAPSTSTGSSTAKVLAKPQISFGSNPVNSAIRFMLPDMHERLCPAFVHEPPFGAYDEVVTVNVGSGDNVKDFICHKLFYNFFYTGKHYASMTKPETMTIALLSRPQKRPIELYLGQEPQDPASTYWKDSIPLTFKVFIDLYIFADYRMAPQLQDVALTLTMFKIRMSCKIPVTLLAHAAANTAENDQLIQCIAHLMASFVDPAVVMKYHAEIPSVVHAAMNRANDTVLTLFPVTRAVGGDTVKGRAELYFTFCLRHRHVGLCNAVHDRKVFERLVRQRGVKGCMEKYEKRG
ncbi:hypothetical protein BU23DRAFT_603387 [Bimuria novae-zelandiae CBS 107.79]|uniref:Uncharacterized protein n=1 Tax=Bimuria novae-zelandiae CBS 107.79 TaxID=1447943 RepID=A0A6A5UZX3_9PLEO|nr:hypothetical protein BU23DRAFT_603387 [Bimuria novae-zelandiae CBS 107.79]